MKIYFDTEFTGLHQGTSLISIGMTDEEGRTFYAELNDYDKAQVDDWIQENVINKLKFKKPSLGEQEHYIATRFKDNPKGNDMFKSYSLEMRGNKEEVGRELGRWFEQYDSIIFVSDVSHYDFVLLIDLVYGHALSMPYEKHCSACYDINQDIANYYNVSQIEAFNKSREDILKENSITIENEDKHNALYDALVIKEIYNIINKQ